MEEFPSIRNLLSMVLEYWGIMRSWGNWKFQEILPLALEYFTASTLKEKERVLQMQIQKLLREKETNFSDTSTPLPSIESPTSDAPCSKAEAHCITDDDECTTEEKTLVQEMEEKLQAQQLYFDRVMEERKRQHEAQMRENWSKFRDAMEEKIRSESEQFNRWTNSPD